jgi:hypothetical protein
LFGVFRKTSAAAMTKRVEQLPLTVERLERALVLLAYFIELDGDVHLPMYEKFETELAELKKKPPNIARGSASNPISAKAAA